MKKVGVMMNKLNKKWIIGISIVAVILALVIVISINSKIFYRKENDAKETIVNEYSAYVSINPLIKLSFKVSCQNNSCTEPIITDTELINEDAKEVYKDLALENKTLKETIGLLVNTVRENDIAFKEVHIYTNYDNEQEFRIDSVDYEIVLDIKEEQDLEKVIDKLITEDRNTKTKEIIVPATYSITTHDKGLSVLEFTPLEREDLFSYLETERNGYHYNDISVKVTVSGPADIIDTLPDRYEELNQYIYGFSDTAELGIGTHKIKLNFISSIKDVEVLTLPIECQIKIVTFEEWRMEHHIPMD